MTALVVGDIIHLYFSPGSPPTESTGENVAGALMVEELTATLVPAEDPTGSDGGALAVEKLTHTSFPAVPSPVENDNGAGIPLTDMKACSRSACNVAMWQRLAGHGEADS